MNLKKNMALEASNVHRCKLNFLFLLCAALLVPDLLLSRYAKISVAEREPSSTSGSCVSRDLQVENNEVRAEGRKERMNEVGKRRYFRLRRELKHGGIRELSAGGSARSIGITIRKFIIIARSQLENVSKFPIKNKYTRIIIILMTRKIKNINN